MFSVPFCGENSAFDGELFWDGMTAGSGFENWKELFLLEFWLLCELSGDSISFFEEGLI